MSATVGSHAATFYRTALLLGLTDGATVHRWAEAIIEREPNPSTPYFDVVSADPADLSALRDALWPLVIDPDPLVVLEAILGRLSTDLASGRRSVADTLTVLRLMRSMLRLPRGLYAELNAALVEQSRRGRGEEPIAGWLQQFAGCGLDLSSGQGE